MFFTGYDSMSWQKNCWASIYVEYNSDHMEPIDQILTRYWIHWNGLWLLYELYWTVMPFLLLSAYVLIINKVSHPEWGEYLRVRYSDQNWLNFCWHFLKLKTIFIDTANIPHGFCWILFELMKHEMPQMGNIYIHFYESHQLKNYSTWH